MIVRNNIKTYSISWLGNTYNDEDSRGVIRNYYTPETMGEFTDLCKRLYLAEERFLVVGHTSNLYFLPNSNIENVVSTRKLTSWKREGDVVECECGVHVKALVRDMVEEGIEGYACMIDLPGTIGGAIYGNAGVSHDSIAKQLIDVTLLMPDGTVETIEPDRLNFEFRSSSLKKKSMDGVILSCRLRCMEGDRNAIRKEAEYVHQWRMNNQPGPSRNLGTTTLYSNADRTLFGIIAMGLAKVVGMLTKDKKMQLRCLLAIMGAKHLYPYMSGLNRYMWTDEKGHEYFDDYKRMIERLFNNARLEIEEIG